MKRSIDNAYRALTNLKEWSYYYYRGRINTAASYSTGTIAYTHSTRTVTLSSGTLPSNTDLCILRIGSVDYPVVNGSTNIGAGTFQLSVNANPGSDVAAGTAYTLYQDTYPLPVNFSRIGTVKDTVHGRILQCMAPNDFVAKRLLYQPMSIPFWYVLRGDPSFMAMEAISFYPPPDAFYQYDYMGLRYPRPFTQPIPYKTGTVSTSTTTLTGVGTAFTSSMVGCIVRFSTSTTAPTGVYGTNPYVEQRVITSYSSATSLGLDQALSSAASGVAYEISDPIDMEAASLYTAFLRRCEFEMGQMLNRDDVDRLKNQYDSAIRLAMEADNRSMDDKPSGPKRWERVPSFITAADDTA